MAIGLVGRKVGMTRIFEDDGSSTPVSVIQIEPNFVTQVKTLENDGYIALQITTGSKKVNRTNKAMAGTFAKASVPSGRGFWEFRCSEQECLDVKLGDSISIDRFKTGQTVDVTGTSKGKGFAGPVKRHNFSMQDATHGNSLAHRAHGSIGQNQSPGKVFKGKKMAGQMGNVRRTIQSLSIAKIDSELGLIMVKGSIPGAPGGNVIINPGVKAKVEEANRGS